MSINDMKVIRKAEWKIELILNSIKNILKGKHGDSKIRIVYKANVHNGEKLESIEKEFSCNSLFVKNDRIYYTKRKNARSGYSIPFSITSILLIEEDLKSIKPDKMTFKSFEKKFDKRFISDEKIKKLFEDGYGLKSNFKPIGKKGKRVMKKFLSCFKNISTSTEHYNKSSYSDCDVIKVWEYSDDYTQKKGRDISISHQTNIDMVYYSSEYPGCGNGSYYIVANEKVVLYLEDD